MTDISSTQIAAPDAAEPEARSTIIDPDKAPSPSGAGVVTKPADETSLRDAIQASLKETDAPAKDKEPAKDEAPAAKEDPKQEPAKDEKAEADKEEPKGRERGDDGKFKPAVKAEEPEAKDAKQEGAEGSEHGPKIKAPDRLLPDARDKWTMTPRAVQRDIDNMVREHEAEITRQRETTERYEAIRPFDELAKSNGRDLRDSLLKLNQIENLLKANPFAGLNAILAEIGPRKADGQPISLLDIAQHINQRGPEEYQRIVQQGVQQQQTQQKDAAVTALQQEVMQLRAQQQAAQLEAQIIAPFRAAHPRYDELSGDIAFFLKSGRIPEGLSQSDRLEAAYILAERVNPSPDKAASEPSPGLDREARVEPDFSGSKSIKSAPGSVSDVGEVVRTGSIREMLSQEMKKARVS